MNILLLLACFLLLQKLWLDRPRYFWTVGLFFSSTEWVLDMVTMKLGQGTLGERDFFFAKLSWAVFFLPIQRNHLGMYSSTGPVQPLLLNYIWELSYKSRTVRIRVLHGIREQHLCLAKHVLPWKHSGLDKLSLIFLSFHLKWPSLP